MYKLPKDIVPGVDKLVLEGNVAVKVTAVYPLSESNWAIDTEGAGMVQAAADVRVRVQTPA